METKTYLLAPGENLQKLWRVLALMTLSLLSPMAIWPCQSQNDYSCSYQNQSRQKKFFLWRFLAPNKPCISGVHGEMKGVENIPQIDFSSAGWSIKFLKEIFNKKFYDPTLTHWVIYIPSTGDAHEELSRWSSTTGSVKVISASTASVIPSFWHSDEYQTLNGDSHLWALVFSTNPIATSTVTIEQSKRYIGPSEAAFNSAVQNLSFRGTTSQGASQTAENSVYQHDIPLTFFNIGASSTTNFYAAGALVPLGSNTRDRITFRWPAHEPAKKAVAEGVHCPTKKHPCRCAASKCLTDKKALSCFSQAILQFCCAPPKCPTNKKVAVERVRMVETNFLNGEKGHIGVSLIGGATFSNVPQTNPNIFLAAHYYFHNNPYWVQSAWGTPSLFIATNLLSGNVLNEFLAGFGEHGLSFLPRGMGFDIAFAFQKNEKMVEQIVKPALFLGLDYRL